MRRPSSFLVLAALLMLDSASSQPAMNTASDTATSTANADDGVPFANVNALDQEIDGDPMSQSVTVARGEGNDNDSNEALNVNDVDVDVGISNRLPDRDPLIGTVIDVRTGQGQETMQENQETRTFARNPRLSSPPPPLVTPAAQALSQAAPAPESGGGEGGGAGSEGGGEAERMNEDGNDANSAFNVNDVDVSLATGPTRGQPTAVQTSVAAEAQQAALELGMLVTREMVARAVVADSNDNDYDDGGAAGPGPSAAPPAPTQAASNIGIGIGRKLLATRSHRHQAEVA
mmetsp:Transcript_94/g.215  ORF Transcript_94/g.215 Transcript_94/m.215 type:complete len:289 (-) Transcript_94:497-1363(-)